MPTCVNLVWVVGVFDEGKWEGLRKSIQLNFAFNWVNDSARSTNPRGLMQSLSWHWAKVFCHYRDGKQVRRDYKEFTGALRKGLQRVCEGPAQMEEWLRSSLHQSPKQFQLDPGRSIWLPEAEWAQYLSAQANSRGLDDFAVDGETGCGG